MSRCKCQKARVVSEVVQSLNCGKRECIDVCSSPICKDPNILGIMAPLIYDEIGINLCTEFALGVELPTTYPTVTSASVKVINATYTYGAGGVVIEAISGRPNCYAVTLSNITVQFAVNLYDAACRLIATIYPTAVYLPPTTAPTYNEDTNPASVELEIFAPYGLSYTASATTPTPVINFIGYNEDNNTIQQGINLFAMAKLLNLSTDDSTVTVGLTLVLQSIYFVGYKVKSEGKIDIPKGSILTPEDSDCRKFVAGELINLAIKPLDLGAPYYEEYDKQECTCTCSCCGSNTCSGGTGECASIVKDDTVVVSETTEQS